MSGSNESKYYLEYVSSAGPL